MTTQTAQRQFHLARVAWQSALAAALCLGIPAGLLFWLVIIQRLQPSPFVDKVFNFLQLSASTEIITVLIGALVWGIMLSRISNYHPMWRLVAASMLGVYVGRRLFWALYAWINYDFSHIPLRVDFAIHLLGLVLSVTFCTGLLYGLMLRSIKAITILSSMTSLGSVLATLAIYVILDQSGIRIGAGNGAMPKIAAICTMVAGISGGTILGVLFSWWVANPRYLETAQMEEANRSAHA